MSAFRRNLATLAGAVTALGVAEIALRPVSHSWHYPSGLVRTIAQYSEGTAITRFEADGIGTYGNRLTGNTVMAGRPLVTLLGDSHLLQEAVEDAETTGAVVENASRRTTKPVNVRQYGWYATGLATYLGEAPRVRQASPAVVVVIVNAPDFGANELLNSSYWRMRVAENYSITLQQLPQAGERGLQSKAREVLARSPLLLAVSRRINVVRNLPDKPPDPRAGPPADELAAAPEAARMPVAGLRALRASYGDRLLIAYTPWCRPSCTAAPDEVEERVLAACASENVKCFSIRQALVADQNSNHRYHRGFHNTGPGQGHLNRHGLAVLGTAIWENVEPLL